MICLSSPPIKNLPKKNKKTTVCLCATSFAARQKNKKIKYNTGTHAKQHHHHENASKKAMTCRFHFVPTDTYHKYDTLSKIVCFFCCHFLPFCFCHIFANFCHSWANFLSLLLVFVKRRQIQLVAISERVQTAGKREVQVGRIDVPAQPLRRLPLRQEHDLLFRAVVKHG